MHTYTILKTDFQQREIVDEDEICFFDEKIIQLYFIFYMKKHSRANKLLTKLRKIKFVIKDQWYSKVVGKYSFAA